MSDATELLKIGKAVKAFGTARSAGKDSAALRMQARVAAAQGYADEEASRRAARYQLGEQAAALAQAGIGPGGTAELVVKDSALAAEMDALNYRYRGLQAARALRSQGKKSATDGYLMAGAQLLSGRAEVKNQRSILSNAEK